jgi:hypothetical protein
MSIDTAVEEMIQNHNYQQETGGRIMRVIIELEFENLPSRVDVENYLKELIDDGSLFYHLAQREA